MKHVAFFLLLFVGQYCFYSCISREQYKQDLLSDSKNRINEACHQLGKARDTSCVKQLLTKILDPRISTDLRFKGMTVNYCRLSALKKISGVDIGRKSDQFQVDTIATNFYLNWAVEQGYLKDKNEVNVKYYK